MAKEKIWDKAVDKIEAVDAKIVTALGGGEQGVKDVKAAAEALRHGHLIDETIDGLKIDRNIIANAWNKSVDVVKAVDVKVAGTLGGPKAAADMAQAAEDLRHGHIIDELGRGLKVDGDIIANAYNKYVDVVKPIDVKVADALGGPKAAADMAQSVEDARHGHFIDAAGRGLKVDGDIAANAAGHTVTGLTAAGEGEWKLGAKIVGQKTSDRAEEAIGNALLVSGDKLDAGLKKIEGLFGHSSTAPQEPSPHHPAETPVNLALANSKGQSKT